MKTNSEEFEAWLKEKYPQVYDLKERYDYESVGYKGRKAAYLAGRASVEKERDELAACVVNATKIPKVGFDVWQSLDAKLIETAKRIMSMKKDKPEVSTDGDKEGLK
jgi:hypothetical protein